MEFDHNKVKFVSPGDELSLNEINEFNSGQGNAAGFDFNNGPEVRPDGRQPRVKSDILQGQRNRGRGNNNNNNNNNNRNPPRRRPVSPTRNPFFQIPVDEQPRTPRTEFGATATTTARPFSGTQSSALFNPGNAATFSPSSSFASTPSPPLGGKDFSLTIDFPADIETPPFFDNDVGVPEEPVQPAARPVSPPGRQRFPSRPAGGRPRVKADERLNGRQRNRGRVPLRRPSRPGSAVTLDEAPRSTPNRGFANAIRPVEDEEPTFLGEVDEFDAPLATRRPAVTRRPPVASRRPSVKVRKRPRKPVGSRNSLNGIEDDCSDPFKCPPTRVADGRKPRVKSDIKARKRNYHNPWQTRQPKRQRV